MFFDAYCSPGRGAGGSDNAMAALMALQLSTSEEETAGVLGLPLHGIRVVWQIATEGRYWHQAPGTLWSDLPSYISELLEAKYRRRRREAPPIPGDGEEAIVLYSFRQHEYVANVDTFLQRNSHTGTQRQLRRALVAQEGVVGDDQVAAWLMRERENEYRLPRERGEPAAVP
jgi:hypothetical protein